MNTTNFEKLITSGIKNLPAESLKEIANYVFFIRKKTFNPKEFKNELEYEMLNDEMMDVSNSETLHLEKEFLKLFGSWKSEYTGDELVKKIYKSRKDKPRGVKL